MRSVRVLVVLALAGAMTTYAQAPVSADPPTYPAQVLDLTDWKLTLPVDVNPANGVADEVKQPQLGTYTDPDWFHLNGAGTGVVFRANVEGARTSDNTKYARSELRDMSVGSSPDFSWDRTEPGVQHVMTLTEAITHTPANKPHVVAAQIHDGSNDVLQVRLEGNRLFLVLDNGFNKTSTLTSNYVLGTPFTVTIKATAVGLTVVYNGTTIVTNFPVTHQSDDTWFFKAGAYVQSNTTNGDGTPPYPPDVAGEYGEVVITGLSVRHEPIPPDPTPTPTLTTPPVTAPAPVYCAGLPATQRGSDASETIVGTSGVDVIVAGGGNDTVYGLGGNDIVCGGDGNDVLKGGPGNDALYGDGGTDRVAGGGGRDRCVGGTGRDAAKRCEVKRSL